MITSLLQHLAVHIELKSRIEIVAFITTLLTFLTLEVIESFTVYLLSHPVQGVPDSLRF